MNIIFLNIYFDSIFKTRFEKSLHWHPERAEQDQLVLEHGVPWERAAEPGATDTAALPGTLREPGRDRRAGLTVLVTQENRSKDSKTLEILKC